MKIGFGFEFRVKVMMVLVRVYGGMGLDIFFISNLYNSRYFVVIFIKKVAEGFYDVFRDGALGYR